LEVGREEGWKRWGEEVWKRGRMQERKDPSSLKRGRMKERNYGREEGLKIGSKEERKDGRE
jgi:hypothetical protein